MFQRILICDGDAQLSSDLLETLTREGYPVSNIVPGEPASAGDLVLCDPGADWASLRHWRGAVVVAHSRVTDPDLRLAVLRSCADDYWVKPLSLAEISARLAAWSRRCGPRLRLGRTVVDFARGSVERDGCSHALSMKEFLLLRYLTERPGITLTRADLLRDALGYYSTLTRTLDMHVSNLRKKIEADPAHPRFIVTAPGEGYKYVPESK